MDFLEELLNEMEKRKTQRARKATGTPTFGPPYSGTGLFSACGFQDAILTAFVGEGESIIDDLPWYPTVYSDTRWEVITQIVSNGEAEPTADCADCPTSYLRTCWLNTCFGRYCRSSQEFSYERAFEMAPGATPRRLIGGISGLPDMLSWGNGQQLTVEDMLAVVAGYSLRNLLVDQAYQGNPAVGGAAGYQEMAGLAMLINTGLPDAFNGQACGALDSDIKPFTGCVGDAGASDISRMLAYLRRQAHYRAIQGKLRPELLRDEIRMRYEMWEEIAEAYPLLEYTRMGANTFAAETMLGRVNEIKTRQALPVDNAWVPVKFDSGIPAVVNGLGNRITADIYYMNRYYGQEPLIYGEYFDMRVPGRALQESVFFRGAMQNGKLNPVDGGRFLIVLDDVRGECINARAVIRPRILVKAPWLQGRITDVCVRLLQPFPSPEYPQDFGGHSATTGTTLHGICQGYGVPVAR